jgi:hydrogenase nickel incorporation protein HypA/HybF
MHELAIAEGVVEAIEERIGAARAVRVVLEVGRLTCVEPDAIRFCFELCAQGTALDGAALEIVEVPGRARCRACGADGVATEGPLPLCPCGSANLELLDGTQLLVRAVEVV